MKEFTIYAWFQESSTNKYLVEAETEEEAKKKVLDQEEEPVKEYPGDYVMDRVFTEDEFEEETGFRQDEANLSDEG